MLEAVVAVVPVEKIAVHFHDTYGQSLPNILASLQVKFCFFHFCSKVLGKVSTNTGQKKIRGV